MDKYNFKFRIADSIKMDWQKKLDTIYTCTNTSGSDCVVTWATKDNKPGSDIGSTIYSKYDVEFALGQGYWIKVEEGEVRNG